MAYHFIKLTKSDGKPVYINGDHVAAVLSPIDNDTLVEMIDDNIFFHVKESPETVAGLLYGVMHE